MKKYVLTFTFLFINLNVFAQDEYIEVQGFPLFGKSVLSLYNSDPYVNDIDVYTLRYKKNDNYHFVRYTNYGNLHVQLIFNDKPGYAREVFLNSGDRKYYDSYANSIDFKFNNVVDTIWISKPIKIDDLSDDITIVNLD